MKRFIYLVTGLAVVTAMFWFFCTPRATGQVTTNDTSAVQCQPATDEQAEMSKRYVELLGKQEEMLKRAEALIATQEEFLKRQAADLDRYEKILDTWEKQQKQYQKYLDSLTK
jgi:hypothetical protein